MTDSHRSPLAKAMLDGVALLERLWECRQLSHGEEQYVLEVAPDPEAVIAALRAQAEREAKTVYVSLCAGK